MTFPKLTFDKPIPVSPLIALDRERCILCYRCTRFSEEVSEDGLLVALNRGARSRDRDVRGRAVPLALLRQRHRALPGRRADLDAVPLRGAALGHPERADRLHRAAPSAATSSATIREGKVKRDPLPQPPGDRPRLALRQGALHVPAPPRAGPRHGTAPAGSETASSEVAWDEALDAAEELLREAGTAVVTALSGSETTEIAYALGRVLRGGLGAHSAVLPEATSDALDAFRAAPLRDRRGGARRRRRRRPGRRAGADRRSVDQGGGPARRRGRQRARRAETCRPRRAAARRCAPSSRHPRQRARQAPARGGARRSRLVGPGRRRRRPDRRARARARLRGEARAAAPSTSPRRPTDAQSPPPGRPRRTATRRTRSRSSCSSSPATRRPPTRASARSPRKPSA